MHACIYIFIYLDFSNDIFKAKRVVGCDQISMLHHHSYSCINISFSTLRVFNRNNNRNNIIVIIKYQAWNRFITSSCCFILVVAMCRWDDVSSVCMCECLMREYQRQKERGSQHLFSALTHARGEGTTVTMVTDVLLDSPLSLFFCSVSTFVPHFHLLSLSVRSSLVLGSMHQYVMLPWCKQSSKKHFISA